MDAKTSAMEGMATLAGLARTVRDALTGIENDYMTSRKHHPGYVLIPKARFEHLRELSKLLLSMPVENDGPVNDALWESMKPFERWARWALEPHLAATSSRTLVETPGMLRDAEDSWAFTQMLAPDEPRLRLKHFRAVLAAIDKHCR